MVPDGHGQKESQGSREFIAAAPVERVVCAMRTCNRQGLIFLIHEHAFSGYVASHFATIDTHIDL
jgi:hypothetical protein